MTAKNQRVETEGSQIRIELVSLRNLHSIQCREEPNFGSLPMDAGSLIFDFKHRTRYSRMSEVPGRGGGEIE